MPAAPRLQGITLPVPDLAAAEKFYRWVLAMKEAAEASAPGEAALGWGKEDRVRLVDVLASLEIRRMTDSGDADAPLLAGDHQFRIERREPDGIYGAAFVVAASRLPDLVRTLERFGVQHRLDRNHLLAVDPAGRILAVNGVRSG